MFKKSIFSKLFFMNTLLLIFILIFLLGFQFLFFESYYKKVKIDKIQSAAEQLQKMILDNEDSLEINKFIETIYAEKKIVLNAYKSNTRDNSEYRYNSLLPQYVTRLVLETEEGKEYTILSNEYSYMHEEDNKIGIEGIKQNNYIIPLTLNIDKEYKTHKGYPAIDSTSRIVPIRYVSKLPVISENTEIIKLQGSIKEVYSMDQPFIILRNRIDSIARYFPNNMQHNDHNTSTLIEGDMITGYENIIHYRRIQEPSNILIVGITPLSAVDEVTSVMSNYYVLLFIVVFVLIIFTSIFYSKLISTPLIKMSKIANNIANLDFTEKYTVKSQDEMGRLGESLNNISDNLKSTIAELKKANIQLTKDIKEKKIAEEKRKEFIGNISHELKTPLTIIHGYTNNLKKGIFKEKTNQYYDDIIDETNKMSELVREMLEMSRLESPTFKLNQEPFDLWSVFLKVHDKMRGFAAEKNIHVNYNMDEAVVYGDEKRIKQVITNLYTNAIKYTPVNGEITVNIYLHHHTNDYMFEIENTGVNIPENEIEKIWDSFYRAEKSRNKKFGGTGIGLSIVKAVLELHKSDFGVTNTTNGVKFYFTLQQCTQF